MARDRIPESVKHPLSLEADYANPRLYGGAALVVGALSLVVGVVGLALGSWLVAAFFGGFAILLCGVGYWMYTRAA